MSTLLRSSALLCVALAATSAYAEDAAPVPPTTAPTTAPTSTATPPETTSASPASLEPSTEPASTAPARDYKKPDVLDFSIAADNPVAAPVITAMLRDDTAVESAVVHWRTKQGTTWDVAPMAGGASGMFLARLPDGPQKVGFVVWLEVKDAAGNTTTLGSERQPLEVDAAVEGNEARAAREAAEATRIEGPHPAWVMLSLGAGIAASAGATAFALDLATLGKKTELVTELLAKPGISERREQELKDTQVLIDRATLQDGAAVGVLGVVGVASLATGVVLLTFAAMAE